MGRHPHKMAPQNAPRHISSLWHRFIRHRSQQQRGGCIPDIPKLIVVEYERGWSEFAPIIYPYKGHFLCYWLAVVHTWQWSSPGEAVSRGTRPTWNAHTGEEIGLETNRRTEDAAARWGNWKKKTEGERKWRDAPLNFFHIKIMFSN